jgi:formate/nitrite transporter
MAFNPPAKMCTLAGNAGVYKSKLPTFQLLLRGFLAGAYIAIGSALATICSTGVAANSGPGISNLITGAVFPVGLIAIVLTGAELFTGDCMLIPMAAMMKRASWSNMIRAWIWVYIGNLIGSVFYAYLMVAGPLVTGGEAGFAVNAFGMRAVEIAVAKTLTYKVAGGWGLWSCFLKGIGCNFLVNIAILLALTADDVVGKFFGIWFPIMAFVSTGLEHSVANMYFLPTGLMLVDKYPEVITKVGGLLAKFGGLNLVDMWFWNELPATLGNIVGGFIFISVFYFYAFRKELPKE